MQHEENTLIAKMLAKSREMQRNDRMSRDVEATLVSDAQSGDEAAMNRLCEYHALFVMSKALAYRHHYDINDLFVSGLAGLVHAVQRYSPDRGCGLLSYATHWISQRIRYEIYNNFNTIRIPVHAVGTVFAFRAAERRDGAVPDFDTLRNTKTARKITDTTMRHIYQVSQPPVSLNKPLKTLFDDGDDLGLDTLMASGAENVDAFSDADYLDRVMNEVLTAKERHVITQYIVEERTLDDIGQDLGVCRERIRQLKVEALRKMRDRMAVHDRRCRAKQAGLMPLPTRKADNRASACGGLAHNAKSKAVV